MPLVRFKIRNELSLGGPELNRSAAVENEEPKAILGAVEVAGLIGILRQLGDLAEFSAEVFNGIQEEVTVTASRCQKLTSRVRRIESALSPLEKAVLSQTSHIHFAYTAGTEWHPRIRNGRSHFVQSDLPLCVMESYEQCRDPPPLHLLDRFAVGGSGSCLRKYSDPTFFRKELGNPNKADDIKVQKDQAHRKRKKKKLPQRNICRSNAVSTSDETNGARLSSLTDDRQTTSQSTSTVDMPCSSNMQELSDVIDQSHLQGQSDAQEQGEAQVQSDCQEAAKTRDSITGSGYIEYVINQSPVDKPEVKLVEGFLSGSLQPANRTSSTVPEGCIEVVHDNIFYSTSEDLHVPRASIVCDEKKETHESMLEKSSKDEEVSEIHESKFGPGTPDRVRQNQRDFDRTYILFDEVDIVGEKQSKSQANNIDGTLGIENEGEDKSEQGSETDEFVDARNTIESESESDLDGTPKPKLEHYFGDISTYCSEDANSDNNDESEDIPYEQMAHDPRYENSLDESCSGSCLPEDANVSCCLSDPVSGKTLSHDESSQKPKDVFAVYPSLLAEEAFPDVTILQEEPVGAHPLLAGNCANEKISSEEHISSCPSMKDAITVEKILQEEHLANNPSLAEAVPHEKISPGESVAKYPSFAEIVPQEKTLPEKSLPKILPLEEAVPENMTPAGGPDAGHLSFPKALQDKISPEVLDSKNLSVPEGASQEQITHEKFVGVYPCLAEAVPDESFFTEEPAEPATTCLSLTKVMPVEKLLPEKPSDAYQYLEELPKEKILQEKFIDSAHPSFAEVAAESNLSSEVPDSTNVSVAEAVPQEQITVKESVDINQRLAEAVPDKRFLPEELLETYPSLAQLPEEKISHEEIDDATHPSEAVSDEEILSEVSDSTIFSVEEALPQDQTLLEEFVNPCLVEAVTDERLLPEEPVTTCLSLKKAATIEGVLPEKALETYPYLAELPEEADDAAFLSEAVSDEQNSPKVPDSTNSPIAEVFPQEQVSIEDFLNVDPCLPEAVPDKRVLPDVPVTSCIHLTKVTKVVPIEEVLPEEPLEECASLEKLPKDISQKKTDDATQPSCAKAESDENVSPEVLDSKNSSAAEAIPQEQIYLEEFVGMDPCLGEAVVDERDLPEEFDTACLSLTKAAAVETTFPEEPLEVYPSLEELTEEKISQQEEHSDATSPFSEVVGDETISPLEGPSSTYPSLEESIRHEKTSHRELVATNLFLELDVPKERGFTDKPGVTYQSSAEAISKEKNLPEEPLPTYPSLAEAVLDEKISIEEPDTTCPPSAEAVSDEKMSGSEAPRSTAETCLHNKTFPEEPFATDMSSTDVVFDEKISGSEAPGSTAETCPHNKTFHEEPIATDLSSTEDVFDEKISGSEAPGSTAETCPHNKTFHEESIAMELSSTEAVFDEKIQGSEAPGSTTETGPTNVSVAEAVPQEQISVEESVDINQRFAEAVPDERFLPEELLETYPSLEQLPEEKISHEETDDATHPSEAVSDEKILSEVSDSTNLSVEEALPQDQTLLEEFVGINSCLVEAVPDERLLPEEPVTTCLSLKKAATIEGVLPEKPLETYPTLAELPEEADDAASLSEAVSDEQISPKVPDSTNSPIAEVVLQEQVSIEDFFSVDPCLPEAVPDKRVLPDVPVTSCIHLTKVVPIEEVLPEEPLEAFASLEKLPKDISQKKTDDATQPSCAKAESDENVSPEVLDSKNSSAAEAIPHEQISLEEFVGIDPCLGEAVVDERDFPEEFDTACLSLTKAVAIETTFPEEPLEVYPSLEELTEEKNSQQEEHIDATNPFSEVVGDETISPLEGSSSTYPSLEESVRHEKTSHRELVGTNPFLKLDVPKERGFTDKPGVTYQSSAEAISKEKNLPEEPLPTYPYLAEAVPDEKISIEEPDTTCPPSAEAVSDEKISDTEAPGSTTETGPHNKTFPEEPFAPDISLAEAGFDEKISEAPGSIAETFPHNKTFPEKPFAMDISLTEVVFDEKISGSEGPGSTAKTCPHNKSFHEGPIATDMSSTDVVFDEKISGSEAPGSTAETCPHNKTFHEEPIATDLSWTEDVFDEKISGSEAPGSTAETCPHNKTFHEEPIATDLSSTEDVFDEKISGSEAPGSTAETCPHNKTFHDEPIAMEMSSTEVVFDEKIPGSEAPGSTTETGPHYNTFPEAPVPEDNILPKEPAAAYLALAEGIPDQKVFLDDAALLLFAEAIFDQKFSPEVPDSSYPSFKEPEMPVAPPSLVTDLPAKNILVKGGETYDEPHTASDVSMNQKSGFLEPESADRTVPLSGGTVTICPDTQESLSNGTNVESVSIWSNGGLLGLAPLKPPVFAEPNSVSKHIQNENNEASVLSTRKQDSLSRSVEDTEKSSLPLVVSDPTSQQHSNMLSHSHPQTTGTSFRVFGLSHRLLMAGFRGNSSSTCKLESIPTTSYDTKVAAVEDKSQQTPGGSRSEEQLEYESSLFGSPTSSPPVEHMKISFNTKDAFPVSKLKLRIPCQPENGENADMFPSFQLVPEVSNSDDDDDNSDTFCQSSPCVSDNCLSDSELWEFDESPRKYVSSLKHVEERSRHGDMGSFSGSFLDLPCYDAVDHQSTSSRLEQDQEQEQVPEYIPSVSEIIRDWPPNQPKCNPRNEGNADANAVLKKRKINLSDDDGER